ncbi:MAG: phospholipase [Planctomycetaceae bacterium]|nr:phospholipase [Planctomycetaceae bacterium]
MTVSAAALRELHRIHRQITDLKGRLDRCPKQVRAAEALLARLEDALAKAKEALTQTRVSADSKQLQLREREHRIQDLQIKLNTCSGNREYQTLKEQIAADKQANSVLSDEILEALEKIDVLQAELTKTESDRNSAAAALESLRVETQGKQERLEAELRRVTLELSQAEQALPSDFKADYVRIARARGEDTLAQVDGNVCSCCYHVLTTQTINELLQSKPVSCKSCGALLYLPEDREPYV